MKRFNCVRIGDKKMDRSKWFIKWYLSDSKNIRLRTSLLRSDLCDYSDAYIVVKGRISVAGTEKC